MHEVSYTWISGTVHTFNTTPATPEIAALLSGTFAMASTNDQISSILGSIAFLAGSSSSSHALALSFAKSFSTALLAYSAGAIGPLLNEFEQPRNATISVVRIPLIPLYLLLATKLIYVLAVLILAFGAYCFTHPAETELVKAQLSIHGLTATRFQQHDLARQNVVKGLQDRFDQARDGDGAAREAEPRRSGIQRATTAPVRGSLAAEGKEKEGKRDVRIGMALTAEGTWQFVVVANGVCGQLRAIHTNLCDIQNIIPGGVS